MSKNKNIKPVAKASKPAEVLPSDSPLPIDFKHIAWMLGLVILLNLFFFPAKKMSVDHTIKDPSPEDKSFSALSMYLNSTNAHVALFGNSMLSRGIDADIFNSLTKIPTVVIGPGGVESAWWYLSFKNAVCKSSPQFKTVVFFFRDNELTDPSNRVTDSYKRNVDLMCDGKEPLLDRLAYYNTMSDAELSVSEHWPLYQKRKEFKTEIDESIKKKITNIFLTPGEIDLEKAAENVFADTNLNQQLFTKYQFKIDKKLANTDFDFNTKLKTSFLPEMVSLAKQNNIKLIFVRVKRRRDVIPNSQPPELVKYISDLSSYFKKENIVMLDFTDDRRIKEENYTDGDHQDNKNAPRVFTKILADTLPQFYAK